MPQSNPQVKQMMDIVKMSGMSAKDLFFYKCKEMGVNPDEFINQTNNLCKDIYK